jgi:hypothetical protein
MKAILDRVRLADGRTLGDRLAREGIGEMDEWVRGQGPDPIPRAILRLLGALEDRGEALADQAGICLFWTPGAPPRSSWDGPATLAQIVGLTIRLYYAKPGSDSHLVVQFDP